MDLFDLHVPGQKQCMYIRADLGNVTVIVGYINKMYLIWLNSFKATLRSNCLYPHNTLYHRYTAQIYLLTILFEQNRCLCGSSDD